MRKKITFAIILLLAVINGFAKQVDQSVIRKVAVSSYFEQARLTQGCTFNSIGIQEMIPTKYNGNTVYYTLTMKAGGWIVVAADDAVTPVLAYSFEDNMNNSSLPPQFISWMEKYQKQIDDAVTRNLPASDEIIAQWAKYTNYDPNQPLDAPAEGGVLPLILHNWDQGFPFNLYCPVDPAGPGGHPWAGCVATAMCQVMYYYRFPQTGNGQHCYTPSGYPEQCANFGATTYNWDMMLNSASGARPENDSAIALLLWHAGISVNMMYSASGSGAYSEDARNAMVNNFRFSSNASYLQRGSYSVPVWDSILKANLEKKMPIYYDGYGSGGGHAFNLDGYQGTNFYHFNWGWSGTANGYYYLNNLNPAGYNFSDGEGAIVNLFPDTISNTYPYPCQNQITLHSVQGTFDDGSGPALNYHNNGNCSWLIAPQNNEDSVQNITITFNYFSTVAGNGIVRIYKGTSTSDSLKGEYSGTTVPPSITINGPRALVTFTSGSTGQDQGWLITFSGKVMDWCKPLQYLTETSGTVTDGSLYFNYHNNTSCRWKIIPTGSSSPLTLTFTSFRTQANHDILDIYDFGTEQLLAEYSGIYSGSNLPPPVTASSGQMFLLFYTDQSVTDAGWEANYSTAVGTDDNKPTSEIKVYPNPASDYLYIESPYNQATKLRIEISNMNGSIVLVRETSTELNATRLDVSHLTSGLYFIKLISEKGSVVKKIVIE